MRELMRSRDWESWICGPLNHYRWSKSGYGDHVSAVVESVNQSRLLLCNVDVVEHESLRTRKMVLENSIAELKTSLKVLQSEQRQNEDEAAKLQREREDILSIVQQERKRRCELESRIRELEVGVKEQEKIAVQASQQFEYCMMPSDYSFYFLRNWSKTNPYLDI